MSPALKTAAAKYKETTLVILAHGSRTRPEVAQQLAGIQDRIKSIGNFADVLCATMQGGTSIEDIVDQIDTAAVVGVPFLMSDGPLAHSLAENLRIGLKAQNTVKDVYLSPPIGISDEITKIADQRVAAVLASREIAQSDAHVIVIGHGAKKSTKSREATQDHVEKLISGGVYKSVTAAFLEEAPYLDRLLAVIEKPVALVGLFASPGTHAVDDLNEALALYTKDQVIDAGYVGAEDAIADLINACARAATHSSTE